jgi:hypothetical protein
MSQFTVKENGREQTVIIPPTGDRSYDDYLVEAEYEKTTKELRSKPPPEKSKLARSEVSERLREYRDYNKRRASGSKKYF